MKAGQPEGPRGAVGGSGKRGGDPDKSRSPFRRFLLPAVVLLPVALLVFSCTGCSPVYVAKAGWAEMKILRARRPFQEVLADPGTPEETRHKLLLAQQARAYAIHMLGMNAGDSYTTFTQLESDTLAWVLSAAFPDRLEPKTWWFPIVGRVPYKGYSSEESALKAQQKLENDLFDTYLRTTSAFSTLGWFSDPLLSSLLRYDDVELVTTIIHELSHNHLFVKGRVRFNESFATFMGRTGAIRFFCGPGDPVSNPEECALARDRWTDYQAFSVFLDEFVADLQSVYARTDLSVEEKIRAREELFASYRARYGLGETAAEAAPDSAAARSPVAEPGATANPGPAPSPMIRSFLSRPLNNATLLARMRYYHRLPAFQAYLDEHDGDLRATLAALTTAVRDVEDPFGVLPKEG